jgi:hypothetical protein
MKPKPLASLNHFTVPVVVVDIVLFLFIKVIKALFQGQMYLAVMRLLMKNRTRYYGRNF